MKTYLKNTEAMGAGCVCSAASEERRRGTTRLFLISQPARQEEEDLLYIKKNICAHFSKVLLNSIYCLYYIINRVLFSYRVCARSNIFHSISAEQIYSSVLFIILEGNI